MRIHTLGSQPPFAALAHRKHWVAAPSVRFLQVAKFSLRAQQFKIRPLATRTARSVLSASRLLRQAAAKGQFGFHPFLPKPMAGLGNIAAPQRIVCSARERFLHLHSLRGQKAGLSAVRPLAIRFSVDIVCSRSERRLRALFTECRPAAFCECRKTCTTWTALNCR